MSADHECPLCGDVFLTLDNLANHFRNKPNHLNNLIEEVGSLRNEILTLKAAVILWRDLARSRAA